MTDGWKSMESAPRDGTRVLLHLPKLQDTYNHFWGITVWIGHWTQGHWRIDGIGMCPAFDGKVERWLPLSALPPLPAQEGE
jgi:hypothetical protein